jgi:PPOX class probable F420-dependent enzyme
MGLDHSDRVVIATYPERAKVINARRNDRVTVLVLSDDFGGEWIQLYGSAEVLDLPEALEPLVEYFRNIAGEHPDWEEYRRAMIEQGKALLRIRIDDWGPISRGGFPARLADG